MKNKKITLEKLQELVEKFNYLQPKLIEHPDYKDGNDFKDIVDKVYEKIEYMECILLKQKIFNQKGFFKINQNYLDEDLVTRLVFHISKRKDRIDAKIPMLNDLMTILKSDEFNLSYKEYQEKLLIHLKSSEIFDDETQISKLVEKNLPQTFSFCEKNLSGEFHTMFSITIRRYITMIIMEIDKFDKSDLNPDILDLHISFAIDWYLMDIKMTNHQKQTQRLVEQIKAEQKQIVIRK